MLVKEGGHDFILSLGAISQPMLLLTHPIILQGYAHMFTTTNPEAAISIYHLLYPNDLYRSLGQQIAADLRVDEESPRISMILNPVTDAALMLCGHPRYPDAWLQLATVCAHNSISIATIDTIHEYLLTYQQQQDPRTGDFQTSAKALIKGFEATDVLRAATACASEVHTWQARTAYELLAAAEYLTTAAIHLLVQGDLSYVTEKLKKGIERICSAVREGLRRSSNPRLFDFSVIRFPSPEG
jgi:hypothetical protein